LVQLIASIFFYSVPYKAFAPNFKYINFKHSRGLLTLGGIFFIIQMGQLVLYETDNIVLSNLFGPKEVVTFSTSYKLFSIVVIIFSIFINPFWSAFTDAYAKKDFNWIKQIFNKLQKSWLMLVVATFVILALSPFLIHLWLKDKVIVPFFLSLSMCLNVIAMCWHMMCCFLLNGVNKVRLQLYSYFICFIINIPMAILLGKLMGITGIVTANFICFAVMGIIFYIQCNKIINRTAKGIWDK
jgi:O-antigen/teichoic acid export membrane protein